MGNQCLGFSQLKSGSYGHGQALLQSFQVSGYRFKLTLKLTNGLAPYDMIQKALGEPNITIEEYWDSLFDFILLAGTYVAVAVVVSYFTSLSVSVADCNG